jgi:hypothetical protein
MTVRSAMVAFIEGSTHSVADLFLQVRRTVGRHGELCSRPLARDRGRCRSLRAESACNTGAVWLTEGER